MTERERLEQFIVEKGWSYSDLAHRLKWSPTFIFGFLSGAWPATEPFRQRFAEVFGAAAAAKVLGTEEQPA